MLKLLLSHVRLSHLLSRRTNRQNLSCKLVQDLNFHGHPVVLGMCTDDYYVVHRINMASQINNKHGQPNKQMHMVEL